MKDFIYLSAATIVHSNDRKQQRSSSVTIVAVTIVHSDYRLLQRSPAETIIHNNDRPQQRSSALTSVHINDRPQKRSSTASIVRRNDVYTMTMVHRKTQNISRFYGIYFLLKELSVCALLAEMAVNQKP